jgi:hypothetical protein
MINLLLSLLRKNKKVVDYCEPETIVFEDCDDEYDYEGDHMENKKIVDKTDPQKREYHLKCEVKYVKGSTEVKGKKIDRTMVVLIPKESDQRTYFLSAWLPDVKEQHYELVGYIPNPIDSNFRCSIHRGPDVYSENHYLFIMTKGVEEDFIEKHLEGQSVNVRIFGEDNEESADSVRESDGNFEVYDA